MAAVAISHLPPRSGVDFRTQRLIIDYAWDHYRYVLTASDADEIMYEGMWESVDDFIEYMQQANCGAGEPIPGTTNMKPPPTTRLYTTTELDAMDAGILPMSYGLRDRIAPEINIFLGGDVEDDESDEDFGDGDEDDDNISILTDFDGEPLPIYESERLPAYRPPVPSYHSHITKVPLEPDKFSGENVADGVALSGSDRESLCDESPIATEVEEAKYGRFSLLRPRLRTKLQGLKQKYTDVENVSTAKVRHVKEKFSEALHGISDKRFTETRKVASRLNVISPKRAFGRARRFITLGRYQV
ncbi:hypothetical protein F5Y19DRAFT_473229 [Xylariaceae sp. FL1651]|nr:hypothetical protein F5Y19DRAFT_473229 [Xylariaceae sp. FL1651]